MLAQIFMTLDGATMTIPVIQIDIWATIGEVSAALALFFSLAKLWKMIREKTTVAKLEKRMNDTDEWKNQTNLYLARDKKRLDAHELILKDVIRDQNSIHKYQKITLMALQASLVDDAEKKKKANNEIQQWLRDTALEDRTTMTDATLDAANDINEDTK